MPGDAPNDTADLVHRHQRRRRYAAAQGRCGDHDAVGWRRRPGAGTGRCVAGTRRRTGMGRRLRSEDAGRTHRSRPQTAAAPGLRAVRLRPTDLVRRSALHGRTKRPVRRVPRTGRPACPARSHRRTAHHTPAVRSAAVVGHLRHRTAQGPGRAGRLVPPSARRRDGRACRAGRTRRRRASAAPGRVPVPTTHHRPPGGWLSTRCAPGCGVGVGIRSIHPRVMVAFAAA